MTEDSSNGKNDPCSGVLVYDVTGMGEQADRYTRVTKDIGEKVGIKYGAKMQLLVTQFIDGAPVEPTYPPDNADGSGPDMKEIKK